MQGMCLRSKALIVASCCVDCTITVVLHCHFFTQLLPVFIAVTVM